MSLRNRVDPWGDLHAVSARGLLTGNRGCLVDGMGQVVRHHRGPLWISCLTSFRGWRHPLTQSGRWTPIFFLDDAVALAAGHRPCGLCRRPDYLDYREAVAAAVGSGARLSATDLNRRLAAERLRRGGGLERARDRRLWTADIASLPTGSVVLADRIPVLVLDDRLMTFSFDGWVCRDQRPDAGPVTVLTPPTSVMALDGGFSPLLHPTAFT
ncbi:MAG: hypothetical protein WD269_04800 [Acidimicrobiia bacterium]